MNVDHILITMNDHEVEYILVGGMNFLLRHRPILTYDVDLWVQSMPENCLRTEGALAKLDAEWGADETDWRPVRSREPGWLGAQSVYCLTSPHGAIDIFLTIKGLSDWHECQFRALQEQTASGVPYTGLSDEDMLTCQHALDEQERKVERIRILEEALRKGTDER